jgi:hypothetical protein
MAAYKLSTKGFRIGMSAILLFLVALIAAQELSERTPSLRDDCPQRRKQLQGAKEAWAYENKKGSNDVPNDSDLFGHTGYIRERPACPEGGTYTIGRISDPVRCSIHGTNFIRAERFNP